MNNSKKRITLRSIIVLILGILCIMLDLNYASKMSSTSFGEILFASASGLSLLSFIFYDIGKKTGAIVFSLLFFLRGILLILVLSSISFKGAYDGLAIIVLAISLFVPAITWLVYIVKDGKELALGKIITILSIIVCVMFQLNIIKIILQTIINDNNVFFDLFTSFGAYSVTGIMRVVNRPECIHYCIPSACLTIIIAIGMFPKNRIIGRNTVE